MGSEYFQTRLAYDLRREVLWRVLYRYYFSLLIADTDCVLELGAGYGHFINQVRTKKAIAVDSWEGFTDYLRPGIEARVGDVTDLSFLASSSIDFVFASNLFEHLSQNEFASVLRQLKRVLASDGTLNLLQPNYYYASREYFDDYTHRTIYSHTSICDFLEAHVSCDRMQAAFSAADDQVATTSFASPHSPIFAFALETPWQADVHSSSSKMTE